MKKSKIKIVIIFLVFNLSIASETLARNADNGQDDLNHDTSLIEYSSKNSTYDNILEEFEVSEDIEGSCTDELNGFDELQTSALKELRSTSRLPDWLDIDGEMSFWGVLNLGQNNSLYSPSDHQILRHLRNELDLNFKIKFNDLWRSQISIRSFYDTAYSINGRNKYTDDFLDSMEDELEWDEVWLQGSISDNLDLKIGRQIVVWGKSDNLRVTDVLNPLDIREPGMVDIEDLRLPVTMSKLDYYLGTWNLSAVILSEMRFNKEPEWGSDYYGGLQRLPSKNEPSMSLDNLEYAFSLSSTINNYDVSFYLANIYDNFSHIKETKNGFKRKYSRLKMFGAAINYVTGNWLLKSEIAYFHGFEFYGVPEKEFDRLDTLIGFEYSGIKETTICLELANRNLLNFDERLKNPVDDGIKNDVDWGLRVGRDFLHDRLEFTALYQAKRLDLSGGAFGRFQFDYELTKDIELCTGIVIYQSGDRRPFNVISHNDRLFFKLTYNF